MNRVQEQILQNTFNVRYKDKMSFYKICSIRSIIETFHFVEIFNGGSTSVEKLSPEELTDERNRWLGMFPFLQNLLKFPVHRTNGEAAELEVGA